MNSKSIRQPNRTGSAIPLALLAVVVLLVMGVGLLRIGLDSRTFATRTADAFAARCAADAGLAKALSVLNDQLAAQYLDQDNLPAATAEAIPGTDDTLSYTVAINEAGAYTVQSTGQSGVAQRSVASTLRLEGPFESAVFADESMEIKAKTTLDWFAPAPGETLKIGTNSTAPAAVKLKRGSYINGDIFVGVDGDPDIVISGHDGSTVTGNTAALPQERALPSVTVPAWLQALPSRGILTDSRTITAPAKYAAINLKRDGVITVDGDVTLYVSGDVTLGKSSEIRISDTNPNASLVFYLGGNLDAKNSSGFNNQTQAASRFQVFALDDCTQIELKNSVDLYAAIYAPKATIDLKNGALICGSMVARSYVQRNSASFYYPLVLRDATAADPIAKLRIHTWRER